MLTFQVVVKNHAAILGFGFGLSTELRAYADAVQFELDLFLFPARLAAFRARTGVRSIRCPHRGTRKRSFLQLDLLLFNGLPVQERAGKDGGWIGAGRLLIAGYNAATPAAGSFRQRGRGGQRLKDGIRVRESIRGMFDNRLTRIALKEGFQVRICSRSRSRSRSRRRSRSMRRSRSAGVCVVYGENSVRYVR